MQRTLFAIVIACACLALSAPVTMAQEPQGSKTEAGANPQSGGTSGGPSHEPIGGGTTRPANPSGGSAATTSPAPRAEGAQRKKD
jgi:hypothetical protein